VSAPISVGVDAPNLLRDHRGIGRYVSALLRAWNRGFSDRIALTLLVPHAFPALVSSQFERRLDGTRFPVARRSLASRQGLDLVWYPWNGMTWTSPVKSVVTIHDVWPFVSPSRKPAVKAREQSHYLTAVSHARAFIAVSEFTRSEACARLGIDSARIETIPQGVEPLTPDQPVPARIHGVDRYILFVGEAEPRKDVATLVAAMAKLPDLLRQTTALVIAGRDSAVVGPSGAGTQIEITGHVSDARLASLYAGAAVFTFPSRYEGFGLPVLEAMQYGTPVVASDAASIPEAGGDAAIYFRAGDPGSLAEALVRVLHDDALAKRLSAAGRARAAELTQVRCARSTLEAFERVVRG
jgi:glycosyltransferase involved in cell wall biosynthesis